MFLPENIFLSFDLFVGLPHVFLNQRLLILDFEAFHGEKIHLFFFELLQFIPDILIDKISHVFAVVDLRNLIVFPFFRDDVVFLKGNWENTCSSVLFLQLPDVGSLHLHWSINCNWWSFYVVSLFGLGHVDAIDVVLLWFQSVFFRDVLLYACDCFTSFGLGFFDSDFLEGAHLQRRQIVLGDPLLDDFLLVHGQILNSLDIAFVEQHQNRFVFEEWLDGIVEMDLFKDGVPALLTGIHYVDNATFEMGEGCHWLHLDCVHFFELVVKNSRGIDDLVPEVAVLGVADVEGLGGEGVGLDLNVGFAEAVDEAGLSNIGVAGQQNGPLVGVDGGQSPHMFPDFLEVGEWGGYFSDHGAHPSKGSSFEGLAPVEGIGVFDQFEVVSAHILDHVLGGFDVAECQFVVVFVVEDIEEVAVEGVDVLYFGEVVEDVGQFLVDGVLAEFDLGGGRGTLRM